jgi:hypothetical protein
MTMSWMLVAIGLCVMAVVWGCFQLIPQHRLHGWVERTLGVVAAYGMVVTVGGLISALWEIAQ